MNPNKVDRNHLNKLTDLPNVGKAGAEDLRLIGIHEPSDLVGKNSYEMYEKLCEKTGMRHDPCVLDVFISVTRFMAGEDARPWWAYTEERQQVLKQKATGK
ncbi:helix-hairpin-helix domain-containing protein [Glaciimonas soli]|uniref:Mitomycin resistance protein n=1 Tax=Glaciimonas soli TaxID=2590999 RepID=A0A843YY93_9BURK|nr:helix-hairpin-helix domain-containing protein [Glaciimonas soli]MQR02438.1 mitomycin resistance protein [Glaciimonas soli]